MNHQGTKAPRMMRWGMGWVCALVLVLSGVAIAEERFPPPEFRGAHVVPTEQYVAPRGVAWEFIDVGALALALGLAAYFVLKARSRWGTFAVAAASVAYFGFWREGCVCAVGSIQNVTTAAFSGGGLPWAVGAFFLLPLVATLFFGRVFCSGVCPLGAIQDVVLLKPVQVPEWIEAGLGIFAYVYLGLAVLYAAVGSGYVICEWDPFIAFYRRSGTVGMLMLGTGILVASMFVGRVYCRWICPYSVLLRIIGPLSKWKVHVSPKACVDCKLCEAACPFGAINKPMRQARREDGAKRRLLAVVVAVPVIVAVLTGLGWASSGVLAMKDRRVGLAREVWEAEREKPEARSPKPVEVEDRLKAFRKTGRTPDELYAEARGVERTFAWGGTLLGAWIGAVVSWRLVRLALPRRRKDYDADAAGCVACARCFEKCPVEMERRGLVPATVEGQPLEGATV